MTEPRMTPGAKLRQAMANGPAVIPGAFNALVARMAERIGFPAVYQSGAALSVGLAAVPDVGLITQTEFAEQGRYLSQAVTIPVISDADTGFGDLPSVGRTIRLYESAGLAGLHIEDQQMPKKCGHLAGKTVVSCEEMVEKIETACAARRDADFVIIARTDARGVNSFSDAVDRAAAYVDAGADAIFPEALETEAEFAEFAQRCSAPLFANMTEFGKSPLISVSLLGEMGYAAVLFPVTLFRIAMKAIETGLESLLQQGTQQSLIDRMQTRGELYELLNYNPSPAGKAKELDANPNP